MYETCSARSLDTAKILELCHTRECNLIEDNSMYVLTQSDEKMFSVLTFKISLRGQNPAELSRVALFLWKKRYIYIINIILSYFYQYSLAEIFKVTARIFSEILISRSTSIMYVLQERSNGKLLWNRY
jgi:hypothetical protein